MKRIYIKLVLLFAVCVLSTHTLLAGDLTDIRTGYHKTYSRLVLEFNAPVRYQVLENKETPAIIVDVINGGEIMNFQEVNIDEVDPFIREVRFKKEGRMISVAALLNNSYFRISRAEYDWPFRIVVDIYASGEELQTAVAHKTLSAQKQDIAEHLQEEAKSDSATEAVAHENAEKTATDTSGIIVVGSLLDTEDSPVKNDFMPEAFDIESLTKTAAPKTAEPKIAPEKKATTKSKLIWLLGGAFVLFDAMLLASLLRKRGKGKITGKGAVQNAGRKRKVRKNIPQPAMAPKAKASPKKEGLVSPEFLAYLNDALESRKQEPVQISELQQAQSLLQPAQGHQPDDLAEISKAIKLDTLIGTLTEAVSTKDETSSPANSLLAPPEFREIALDLNFEDTDLNEETVKRELIGKDGQEFMRNIKRLYLNN